KPIWAVINDEAYSAAYGIASSTERIFVSRTSGVGSIGVIASHIDQSAFDQQQGIKVTSIFAGKHKNDLSIHRAITEQSTAILQKEVNRIYDLFTALIARNLGVSKEQIEETEAGLFFGEEAINHNLAHEFLTLPAVIDKLATTFKPKMIN